MDMNLFLVEILEKFVASVPQFVVLATLVASKLSEVQKETKNFPNQVEDVKTTMQNAFSSTTTEMQNSFGNLSAEVIKQIQDNAKQMITDVNLIMEGMQNELKFYRENLDGVKNQINLLVRENKAFVEVISVLVSKDPQMIKDGLATVISRELNMTKEELEQFPEQLVTNLPLLKEVLQETSSTLSQETLDGIMESIGYERKSQV